MELKESCVSCKLSDWVITISMEAVNKIVEINIIYLHAEPVSHELTNNWLSVESSRRIGASIITIFCYNYNLFIRGLINECSSHSIKMHCNHVS